MSASHLLVAFIAILIGIGIGWRLHHLLDIVQDVQD